MILYFNYYTKMKKVQKNNESCYHNNNCDSRRQKRRCEPDNNVTLYTRGEVL